MKKHCENKEVFKDVVLSFCLVIIFIAGLVSLILNVGDAIKEDCIRTSHMTIENMVTGGYDTITQVSSVDCEDYIK